VEKTCIRLRRDALLVFEAGLKAASAADAVKKFLTLKNDTLQIDRLEYNLRRFRRIYLLGAGKACADMALSVEGILGDKITESVVSVPYGFGSKASYVRVLEASHPEPDQNSLNNATEILNLAEEADEGDLVICVISGGGSSLLLAPPDGIPLADIVVMNSELLRSGADIREVNTIRKHVSKIKGGRLALKIFPAALVTLIVSDVVGDELSSIASGPTVPDNTTYGDCLNIIEKYGLERHFPQSIMQHTLRGDRGLVDENPREGDAAFRNSYSLVIANNSTSLKAISGRAEGMGYEVVSLSSTVAGDTQDAAQTHARLAREILTEKDPVGPPACIVSGGETTVRVTGGGKGGRNQQFVLSAALEIDGLPVSVLSLGTDGIDGSTDAAGAVCDGNTVIRARQSGLDPVSYLRRNDSYSFFERLGDLVVTGPTGTNVMDIHIVMVGSPDESD